MGSIIEVPDKNGRLYRIECEQGKEEQVKELLQQVSRIEEKDSERVLKDSDFFSRYRIKKHEYMGAGHSGGGGYVTLIEVMDAPDNRESIIIYWHRECGEISQSAFSEWDTLENAKHAYEEEAYLIVAFGNDLELDRLDKLPGLIRKVQCNYLAPWFLAIGKQALKGDYVFPANLQEDPVFNYMHRKEFVLSSNNGETVYKKCIGCIKNEDAGKVVIWEDGTTSKASLFGLSIFLKKDADRPEIAGDIARNLLNDNRNFSLLVDEETLFHGEIVTGKYQNLEGKIDIRVFFDYYFPEEMTINFIPTKEYPNIFLFVSEKLFSEKKVRCIEIV